MKRAWRHSTAVRSSDVRRTSSPPASPTPRRERSRRRIVVGLLALTCGAGLVWWTWSWWRQTGLPDSSGLLNNQAASGATTRPKVKRSASVRVDPLPSPTAAPSLGPRPDSPLVLESDHSREYLLLPSPPPRQEKRISVTVTDSRGSSVADAMLEAEDCGIYMMTDNGRAEVVTFEDGCTFQAGRRDGALMAWSDPVFLDLSGVSQTSLRLEIPAEKTAGMGIQVVPGPGGILVRGVVPGSPAERSGILSGDVITAVEGISTLEMSVREFVELGTGPVGSRVTLSVERTTEAAKSGMEFTLIRQPIEQAP